MGLKRARPTEPDTPAAECGNAEGRGDRRIDSKPTKARRVRARSRSEGFPRETLFPEKLVAGDRYEPAQAGQAYAWSRFEWEWNCLQLAFWLLLFCGQFPQPGRGAAVVPRHVPYSPAKVAPPGCAFVPA